jgi:hypothetical protein
MMTDEDIEVLVKAISERALAIHGSIVPFDDRQRAYLTALIRAVVELIVLQEEPRQ